MDLARKSAESPRASRAHASAVHAWWADGRPEHAFAVRAFAPCALAYAYLRAPTRPAHDALYQEFVERRLLDAFLPHCGLRRLTQLFLPTALERTRPHEQGDDKAARICLNFAYLLVPHGNLRDAKVAARWARDVQSIDDALGLVERSLQRARQLMRVRRLADSCGQLELAMRLVQQLHQRGELTFLPEVAPPFSGTYKALFASEILGLRHGYNQILHEDRWPEQHEGIAALDALDALARAYSLPLEDTPPPSVRPPLKRSMTASSQASRTLVCIAEEYSAFSDSDSDEAKSDQDDPFSLEPFDDTRPSSLLSVRPPSDAYAPKLAPVAASGDPMVLADGARGAAQAQESSMRWSKVFSRGHGYEPHRALDPTASSAHIPSSSVHEKPPEAQAMTPTRTQDVKTPSVPGGYSSSGEARTPPLGSATTRPLLDENDTWKVPDGFGGLRPLSQPTTAAVAPRATQALHSRGRAQEPAAAAGLQVAPASLQQAQRSAQQSVQTWDRDPQARERSQLSTYAEEESEAETPSSGSDDLLEKTLRDVHRQYAASPTSPSSVAAARSSSDENTRPGRAAYASRLDTGALQHGSAPMTRSFGGGAMPDNRPAQTSAASSTFGQGGMPDNARTAPATAQPTSGFATGPMFDNALGSQNKGREPQGAPARANAQKAASKAPSFGLGAMPDNRTMPTIPPRDASAFAKGAMPDNAVSPGRTPALSPTRPQTGFATEAMPDNQAAKNTSRATSFASGPMPDNRVAGAPALSSSKAGLPLDGPRTATNSSFQSGGMPDNAASTRRPADAAPTSGGAFSTGPMPDNRSATTSPVGNSGAAGRAGTARSKAAAPVTLSPPVGLRAARSSWLGNATPAARRVSLFSDGLVPMPLVPESQAQRGLAATTQTPAPAPRNMPSSWQMVFSPAQVQNIESIGAGGPLDQMAQALHDARFADALQASEQAYAALTHTAGQSTWARGVMRSFYRAYFAGSLPDALNYRLRDSWRRTDIHTLQPLVQFVQHINQFLVSRHSLESGWQEAHAFVTWQPDWTTLNAYQALLSAVQTLYPANGQSAGVSPFRLARQAIRTQIQLRGPTERYSVTQGSSIVAEREANDDGPEATSLYASLDDALAPWGEQRDRPFSIDITGSTYVHLQANSRNALEMYYNEMESLLETMVRSLAQGEGVGQEDVALLARIQRAPSVEAAREELRTHFAPAVQPQN